MKQTLFLVISIFVLASCGATFTQKDCIDADWKSIGYADASAGKQISDYDEYAPICKEVGVTPNGRIYQEGYLDGIDAFCTEENGLERASNGGSYAKSCPQSTPYLAGYKKGLKVFKEKQDRHTIERLTRHRQAGPDETAAPNGSPDYAP